MLLNKEKAYLKLVSRIQSSPFSEIDAVRRIVMEQKEVPIVQIREGTGVTLAFKRQHSIKEFNNIRNKYNNYCHYRHNQKLNHFPPINETTITNSQGRGQTPGEKSRDGLVIGTSVDQTRRPPSRMSNKTRHSFNGFDKKFDDYALKGNSLFKTSTRHSSVDHVTQVADYQDFARQRRQSPKEPQKVHWRDETAPGHLECNNNEISTSGVSLNSSNVLRDEEQQADIGVRITGNAMRIKTPHSVHPSKSSPTVKVATTRSVQRSTSLREDTKCDTERSGLLHSLTSKNLQLFNHLHTKNDLVLRLDESEAMSNRVLNWVQYQENCRDKSGSPIRIPEMLSEDELV